jgi:hypothetical protein
MYQLSKTVPVNAPSQSFLSRHDVWAGLVQKANNALPFVLAMQECVVLERGDNWLVRDIVINGMRLRERVTLEPEARIVFERVDGAESGRIENRLEEDAAGNLHLTFAFSLSRQGIESDSEAERAYFAPLEQQYAGAVSSTLTAVRRTAEEEGREKLPFARLADAHGDNEWIFEYYRAADSLNLERLVSHHTEDTTLTFANFPTVYGKDGYRAVIGGLWTRIKAMSHSLSGAWSLHGGEVGIAELICMYTRLDDSLYTIKACTVLRRRDGKICDTRIHADVTQL